MTAGPIVPSKMGNDVSLSPRTNFPVFMLAPVFASMIEPSVLSPWPTGLLRQRSAAEVVRQQAVSGGRWLRSLSLGALQDAPDLPKVSAGSLMGNQRHDLVADPGEAFALPKHSQHLEDGRGRDASGERSAQRLSDVPELHPRALGEGPDNLFGRFGGPRLQSIEITRQLVQ